MIRDVVIAGLCLLAWLGAGLVVAYTWTLIATAAKARQRDE